MVVTIKICEKYVTKVQDAKPVASTLPTNYKLNRNQCPMRKAEKDELNQIPYASAIGSLMYAMVFARSDITYAVGVVRRFMSNPGNEHWATMEWIFRYLKGTSTVYLRFGSGDSRLYL